MDLKKSRKKVIFEPESQNLLQKPPSPHQERLYKEILPFADCFSFSFEELLLLKRQYDKISIKGFLTKDSFRQSLGLFGLQNAPFLSDRIFSIIDSNHDGQADFNDYLTYLEILLNGSEPQKAQQSFDIFDHSSQGVLRYEDIEKMVLEICILWNVMTGEKVVPTPQYLASIVEYFDRDHDGIISLQDYQKTYTNHDIGVFGWYEFLNNGSSEKEMLLTIKPATKSEKFLLDEEGNISPRSPKDYKKHSKKSGLISEGLLASMETQILEIMEEFQREEERLEAMLNPKDQEAIKGPILDVSRLQVFNGENNDEVFPDEDLKDMNVYASKSMNGNGNSEMNASDVSFMNQEGFSKSWELEFLDDAIQRLQNLARQAELLKKSFGALSKQSMMRSQIKEQELRRDSEVNFSSTYKGCNSIRQKTQFNIPGALVKKTPKISIRKNLSIYFGHPNWNLVLNMMVGIRASVHKKYRWDHGEIEEQDFKIKVELDLIDKRGEEFDKTKASRFYDYCPRVFDAIRKKFGITNEDYLRSVGPEQLLGDILLGNLSSLTQFCSSGKSGSLFYYSFDGKFILKTISRMEFLFLQKILKAYYDHLIENDESLLIRIFGLHKIKTFKSKTKFSKIYIIIMQNLLNTDLRLDIKYDIKGSFYGRTSRTPHVYWDRSIPLKDLDFLEDEMKLILDKKDHEQFLKSLEKDCQFFIEHNIIDYSLLIAINFIPPSQQMKNSREKHKESEENFAEKCQKGLVSGDKNKIYILGVIDILTNYRLFFFYLKKKKIGFFFIVYGKNLNTVLKKRFSERQFLVCHRKITLRGF